MTAIVLDTETTGFDPALDRVIELAILTWSPDSKIAAETLFTSHFYPSRQLPDEIVKLTGITDAVLASAPLFVSRAAEIKNLIEQAEAVLGYNPQFDKSMIDGEIRRAGLTAIRWPTLVCAKRLWDAHEPPPKRDLTGAFARFVDAGGFAGAHGALADTRATADVLRAQFALFSLYGTPWAELDPEQRLWWGPSHHVLVIDGVLIVNFGKHSARPVDEVDDGFWRWLQGKDFPGHVKELAARVQQLRARWGDGPALRKALGEWGEQRRKEL